MSNQLGDSLKVLEAMNEPRMQSTKQKKKLTQLKLR